MEVSGVAVQRSFSFQYQKYSSSSSSKKTKRESTELFSDQNLRHLRMYLQSELVKLQLIFCNASANIAFSSVQSKFLRLLKSICLSGGK